MLGEVTDSEALVATLAGVAKGTVETHPELDLLVAYRSEALPIADRARVQDHLEGCRRCTQSLLELSDFENLSSQPPSSVDHFAAVASWRDFKRQVAEFDRPTRRRPPPANKLRPVAYAVAAVALVGFVSLLFKIADLHTSNTELQQVVAELETIQVNPPMIHLDVVTRGDETKTVVELPAGRPYFLVTVFPESTEDYPTFDMVLEDALGQVVWQAESALSEAETLRIIFHRYQIPAGDYRLRVYGLDGDDRQVVNDQWLSLRYL